MRIVAPDDPRNVAIGDPGGFDPGPLADMEREQSRWWARRSRYALALLLAAAVLMLWHCSRSQARDLDGRYTNSPLKGWFDQLASGKGLCCSFADGVSISDVDWDTHDGHYRVRLNGEWIDIPDTALVTEPNRFGPAVVWPYQDASGATQIRCFMPGAGT